MNLLLLAIVTETNSYKLQIDSATAYLKGHLIESCISSKYGADGGNIYRLLKVKHLLTEQQISKFLITDESKIGKVLFQMHKDGYINGQEVPKSTAIRGGKNSYYMWCINYSQLNALLLTQTIKSIINATDRLKLEISNKSDLISKFNEGQMLGKILLDEQENEEYESLTYRQGILSTALYYLTDLFFCLKDF